MSILGTAEGLYRQCDGEFLREHNEAVGVRHVARSRQAPPPALSPGQTGDRELVAHLQRTPD